MYVSYNRTCMVHDKKILILLLVLYALPFISISQVIPARDSIVPADTAADRSLHDTINLSNGKKKSENIFRIPYF